MRRPAALLLLAALAPAPARAGWTCMTEIGQGDFAGVLSRRIEDDGVASPVLFMQMWFARSADQRRLYWTIRAADAPVPEPPRPIDGRGEATIFDSGPDSVSINYRWQPPVRGPIWAHFYGDGRHAGTRLAATEVQVRRFRMDRGVPLLGALSDRAILARLAPARAWTVIATDAAGREVYREGFAIPSPSALAPLYREARARIDAMAQEFRARCGEDPPPEAEI